MTEAITTVLAVATPLVQIVLMGFIGYALWARRDPAARLPVFNRSGFYWWIVALATNTTVALALPPHSIPLDSLAGHQWSFVRFVLSVGAGTAMLLTIEFSYEAYSVRTRRPSIRASRDKFYASMPEWLSWRLARIVVALIAIAILEEVVFRGIALNGLLSWAGLSEPAACAIVSLAFGLGHIYFGLPQFALKTLHGAALCSVALSAGWPAAALAHVLLNMTLTAIQYRDYSAHART